MENRKMYQISFRATEKQREELKRKIRQSGMSQQEFLVHLAEEKEIIDPEGLREVVHEMKKQGVNLNQLAKFMNSRDRVEAELFTETMEEVKQAWQSLKSWLDTHR
jgi:hypothetical protein